MKAKDRFKIFLSLVSIIIFSNPGGVGAAGFCTLSSDVCNNLKDVTACSANKNCFPYSYSGLLDGDSKMICITAYSKNTCITRNYAACIVSPGCSWYGEIENLPVINNLENDQNNFSESPFPTLEDPLSSAASPQILIGQMINIIMGLVGSLALIMIIFGGISWMTAGGNEEKIKKSLGIIVWSVIGLAAVFLSYILVNLIISGASNLK